MTDNINVYLIRVQMKVKFLKKEDAEHYARVIVQEINEQTYHDSPFQEIENVSLIEVVKG